MNATLIISVIAALLIGGAAAWLTTRLLQIRRESKLQQDNTRLQTELQATKNTAEQWQQKADLQEEKLRQLTISLAGAQTDNRNLQDKLDTQKQELQDIQKQLTTEFENIANRVMKQRQEEFSTQSSKQIGDLLTPLKERINDFKEQVSTAFSNETREKASLQAELRQLMELNRTLSQDAVNLTNALKGDVKKQGNWGEFVLEKVLEASGLRKGIEYEREVVVHGLEGEILRPDVILYMPDNKQIIIDSKVSLVAYEQMQQAQTEDEYNRLLKAHTDSLRQHVKELYDKQYQRAAGLNTPDFVLMFVPIEASYTIALQADYSLYDYALQRKIVIVNPTTLLATLHTVSYVWKQENQNRNAQEIARLAGAMYDKLCGSIEDFQKIQKSLDAAQKAYSEGIKKLSDGNGNVLRTAERIKELGAKAGKQLPMEE